ncbi:ParB N-terminal domain-containing protein [Paenibacillus larvae]|uniref:ParB-like nuclease domain protein n=1 Tax=Paenibacillus larvae subsp. larvae TaxID=147375 RepID=A0A6C0QT19_9BACL|nr:ParB N-terminal domain-containing protein [Paenibacillus larvae]MCY9508502.1 ParB N-terminal domain-containing protein [Paenibacillus larvae]MCY9527066.1 ParB N-terminal domain-containing protein [Paenibacillus larvae]QHZ51889.1 ParB-like nuclease domain protein [Paenibacillus larvae subsp. larvae]
MVNVLSNLELVDIEFIDVHEKCEPKRLTKTVQTIQDDGFIKNSVLAIKIDNRYLIIDGTHRTSALKTLGCRRIPIQVIDPKELKIEYWSHLVPEGNWLESLRQDHTLIWTEEQKEACPIAVLINSIGEKNYLYLNDQIPSISESPLDVWHKIVGMYSEVYNVKRVMQSEEILPDPGHVMLHYPAYDLKQIRDMVALGKAIPSGVTRFIVNGRLLNLNIPLHLLTSPVPQQEDWDRLHEQWGKNLRYYSESVYLCEM